jgi:hypothetical protein
MSRKRFIATPIMSEAAIRTIKKQLESRGQEFAHIEDAVKAVMRVAADQTIHGNVPSPINRPLLSSIGRCLSIVPRNMRKEGYIDLEQDDQVEGTLLYEFEASSSNMTHRALPPKQQ